MATVGVKLVWDGKKFMLSPSVEETVSETKLTVQPNFVVQPSGDMAYQDTTLTGSRDYDDGNASMKLSIDKNGNVSGFGLSNTSLLPGDLLEKITATVGTQKDVQGAWGGNCYD